MIVSVLLIPFQALLAPISAQMPLTPDQIRAAYDVNPLLQSGYTGKGVTVAILTPTIGKTFYSDLKAFNSKYGLPDTVISVAQSYPPGEESPNDEITSDTEFVHAMAPDAKILIVQDASYVIDHNAADIFTTSYGNYYWDTGDGSAAKTVRSFNDEYAKSVGEKILLIATSGDGGSNMTIFSGTGDFWRNHLPNSYLTPDSPYITFVGGTALTLQSAPR
jgi:subtilase family serine protease